MSQALDRYAVLGNPVAHSQSPFIHAEFARQTGQNIEYTRVLCAMDGFVEAVRAFAASGARGCNVTVPFKFQSSALAAQVTRRAALAQAANVLRFDADGWLADNTDGIGLVRDLQRNAGRALQGQRVLLTGAGGACRA
jgi:shikimate dehydrogenase